MTTRPAPTPSTTGTLGLRLLLLGVVGAGFSYLGAQILYFGMWAYSLAQQEGSDRVSALLVGGYAITLVLLLGGFVLVGRALAGRAWWLALPSLLLGPVLLLAMVGV
jgi:hypothetical protein